MKIIIAENKKNVRYGLQALLEEQEDVTVIIETDDTQTLFDQIRTSCPELVLLSWEMAGLEGESLIKGLRSICPDLSIVILGNQTDDVSQVLAAGADSFFCKAESPEKLLEAIRRFQSGN